MNVQDTIFMLFFVIFILWRAFKICQDNPAISRLYTFIAIGIFWWAMYAFFADFITTNIFDTPLADALVHDKDAQLIAMHLKIGGWSYTLAEHRLAWGNLAYQFMVGVFYYYTGATYTSVQLFNGLMAAWGGIILLDIVTRAAGVHRVPRWILLLTVFFPSTIFWTTSNLKEGLMFWAICMSMNTMRTKASISTIVGIIAGLLTMIILRPHIALIWIGSIMAVAFVKEGKRRYAAPALIFLAFAIFATTDHTKSRGGWLTEMGTIEFLDSTYETERTAFADAGSTVITQQSKPLPFLGGFIMMFMRPYIWEINSLKYAVAALESWGVFFLTIYVLYKSKDPVSLFRNNRLMLMSGLVIVQFMLLFSYQGNLGILVRYKVQALPAMLTVIDIPLLQRRKANFLQSKRSSMRASADEKR